MRSYPCQSLGMLESCEEAHHHVQLQAKLSDPTQLVLLLLPPIHPLDNQSFLAAAAAVAAT